MADEVKNTEETEGIDFNNTNEPIDSIEKTVEDLKKKIQELADVEDKEEGNEPVVDNIKVDENDVEAEEEGFEIPEFANQDNDSKADGFKETTMKTVNDSINTLRNGAEKVMANPELQKTLNYIKENAMKAFGSAKEKIDEISANPKVQQTSQKAAETLKNAGEKMNEVIRPVVQNVDEFMKKPEVQDTIEKVRTTTADAVEKVSDKVKDFFDKD